ncbi:MAG TPA: L-ribulose-5-phosphate 4-epimerase AraD [Fimbriimonadaceae bacterium]|nr:L-ribulose-5-phosphate 4-epimerase AraD [Fimbriimonadaceae bacterium]
MEYRDLKERACAVNQAIGAVGLANLTWGNASAYDSEAGVMAIKPSGVPYSQLTPDHMVLVSRDGEMIEGGLKPSSDSVTHLVLYRAFEHVKGIVHTHSTYATAWAQACLAIPCLGTTHADHFRGPVPVTRDLTDEEIVSDYVGNTGLVVVEAAVDSEGVPAVLVARHAPFVWGHSIEEALENAIALEHVAEMALMTLSLNSGVSPMPSALLARHFERKHGPGKTYGQ